MWTGYRRAGQLGKKSMRLVSMCPSPAIITFLLLAIDRHESRENALILALAYIGDAIDANRLWDDELALEVGTGWGLFLLRGRR